MKRILIPIAMGIMSHTMGNAIAQAMPAGRESYQTGMVLVAPMGEPAARVSGFIRTDGAPASDPTSAAVAWDETGLQVTFDCVDTNVVALRSRRDDPDLWRDDCVEIFLDPGHRHDPSETPWIHVLASASGAISDSRGGDPWFALQGGGDRRFDIAGVTSRVEQTASGWRAIVTLPWEGLGIQPKIGEVWGINLNRENHPDGEYSGWAPTPAGFSHHPQWGHLVFGPPADLQDETVRREAMDRIARRHAGIPPMRWKAGTARVNITPESPLRMAGYGFRNRPADGKTTDLWAKALALEDADGHRAVLLTLDVLGIERSLARSLCSQLESRFGFRRDQIAICASHTHSGPVVGLNLWPTHHEQFSRDEQQQIEDYARRLEEQLVSLVGDALNALSPAFVSAGSGQATFAVNRRMNREGAVPKLRAAGRLQGPVDYDVPVLAVRSADGRLQAAVFGYACHATVLSDYQWNGDYPGYAQAALESDFPGVTAMFWSGCGGDINPLPRRSVALAQAYGRTLADAVRTVLDGLMEPVSAELDTRYREVDLPMAPPPTREQLEAERDSNNPNLAACARGFLRQLDGGSALPQQYPYPMSRWTLGRTVDWMFLGGEVVVDYAVRLKSENRGRRTWVSAYAHDVMGYIPSRRVLHEGGYEATGARVVYGLPADWLPELEERIISGVSEWTAAGDAEGRQE